MCVCVCLGVDATCVWMPEEAYPPELEWQAIMICLG